MSLLNQQKGNNKKKGNKGGQTSSSSQGSKFIAKGKAAGFSVKPHKAGGSRGS